MSPLASPPSQLFPPISNISWQDVIPSLCLLLNSKGMAWARPEGNKIEHMPATEVWEKAQYLNTSVNHTLQGVPENEKVWDGKIEFSVAYPVEFVSSLGCDFNYRETEHK